MSMDRVSWPIPGNAPVEPRDPADALAEALSEEDRKLVDWVADQAVSRRLTAPVIFLLESSKPLNYVSSQLLVFLSPMLGTFIPKVKYDRLVELLEKRAFIEVLLRAVESREDEFLADRRAKKEAARAARRAGRAAK